MSDISLGKQSTANMDSRYVRFGMLLWCHLSGPQWVSTVLLLVQASGHWCATVAVRAHWGGDNRPFVAAETAAY